MFNARPMKRLLIAASKDQLEPVIQELYRNHVFHIEDFVEQDEEGYEGFRIGVPLEAAGPVSSELIKIRSINNTFGVRSGDMEPQAIISSEDLFTRIEGQLPEIEREVEESVLKRTRLEMELKDYEQRVHELQPFITTPLDLSLFRGYDRFSVFAGYVQQDVEIPVAHEKFFNKSADGYFLIVIVPVENRDEIERFLLDRKFQAVAIPEEEGSAAERIAWYDQEINRVRTEIETIPERIVALKEQYSEFLVACDELLTAEVEQAEAPLRFATTEETFVAEGWVPAEKVTEIADGLLRVTDGKIFVTELEFDSTKDPVPVEYQTPSFDSPCEALVDLYSRPLYSEVDPTLMLSIVFPIFFGLILGDVGYGLVLLAMSYVLGRSIKRGAGKQLLNVLRNASISSIIFGALYSEFIGFSLPWEPLIFSRHLNIGGHAGGHGPQVAELIVLSIWIGILHISLGRILGMVNARRLHHGAHAKKAFIANAGWLGVLWGVLLMAWSYFPIPIMPDLTGVPAVAMGLNAAAVAGTVLFLAGVICIAQENALEVVELPTIISHVFSYARLVAVGLSSVAIAMVVNFIAIGMIIEPQLEHLSAMGIVIIIAGIVVFLLGHTLNTVLGLLGGGLHSIRLHYVEFFTKFYKGGGKKYDPFGIERKFTED
jgi:V/A-type H+-transporting ATPase subunit I